jgi:IS1 family transposase
MAILPKAIYMFNAIPINIPTTFCTEIEKIVVKYIWNHKRPQTAKAILNKSPMLEASQYVTSNYILQSHNNKRAWYYHKTDRKTKGSE